MPKRKNRKESRVGTRSSLHFTGLDGKKYKLTPKQKRFCDCFLQPKGNGVKAAIEAGYDVSRTRGGGTNKRLAASIASENLTKPNIMAYLVLKLEESGFSDEAVTKHHLFNITQFADLSAKNRAIDMYYKLRGLYEPDKGELTVKTVEIVKYGSER